MNVGLCCCYDNHNYGSMLQALAHLRAIELLGHDCEIIHYVKRLSPAQRLRQLPRALSSGGRAKLARMAKTRFASRLHPQIASGRAERDEAFERFASARFSACTRDCVGYAQLEQDSLRYDAVVVGSDQLWLPLGLATNFYNLQFVAPGVRRVSYATSFGVSSIPWYQRVRTADFLRRIDCLSVREDAGARICREVAGVEAQVVVDPTLLLTRDQWEELVPTAPSARPPYVLCYFLGRNPLCRAEARRVAAQTGLPLVALRHLDEIVAADESFGDEAPYDVDPAGFVNLIRNATYVLTDSFHATVFSVIYHRPFATFYRFRATDAQSRNARIDSLLAHVGLEDRLVVSEGGALRALEDEADFAAVDQRLAVWRADSRAFLRNALS